MNEPNESALASQVLAWIDRTISLPMYQTPALTDYDDAVVATLKTVRKMLNGTTRPDASWRSAEAQNEPSDAQVEAAHQAWSDYWDRDEGGENRPAIRAALIAARCVA